jgi:hypothetical protein
MRSNETEDLFYLQVSELEIRLGRLLGCFKVQKAAALSKAKRWISIGADLGLILWRINDE